MKQPKITTVVPALPVPESNKYRLLKRFIYQWEKDGSKYEIIVPVGFEFEASIPRIAWSILGLTPWHPKVLAAACVHDYIYSRQGMISISHSYLGDTRIAREQADKLFFRIMRENGVKKYKCRLAYRAVRVFGGGNW